MSFDYAVYYRINCSMPLFFGIFSIVFLITIIMGAIINRANYAVSDWLMFAGKLCLALFLISRNVIPLTRGGWLLLFEDATDQVIVTGVIEKTEEMGTDNNSYQGITQNNGYGEIIYINQERYMIQTYGNFKVGDCVRITVLPRSHFVLEIEYNTE